MFATILVGGAALAQQGLIIEPWRRSNAAPDLPRPVTTAKAGPLAAPPPLVAPAAKIEKLIEPSAPTKWSPPVVELLVDPWAKQRLARPPRSRWVPENIEIIDPWPEPEPATPRVASLRAVGPRAAIF